MSKLNWDGPGDRLYETGVDQGVLYLPDGSAVPWNGITSVSEVYEGESTQGLYFDGEKIYDYQLNEDFAATLKVFTYPEEFNPFDGVVEIGQGLYVKDQRPERFSLSYRTKIGNDLDGDEHGYKIHLVYNLSAIPEAATYSTVSKQFSPLEFSWGLSAIPEEIPGYFPTAHAIIDTTAVNKFLLRDLEEIIYGDTFTDPRLPTIQELTDIVSNWELISIIDHGDGTWTAEGPHELIWLLDESTFQINEVDAVYTDESTYEVTTTLP